MRCAIGSVPQKGQNSDGRSEFDDDAKKCKNLLMITGKIAFQLYSDQVRRTLTQDSFSTRQKTDLETPNFAGQKALINLRVSTVDHTVSI